MNLTNVITKMGVYSKSEITGENLQKPHIKSSKTDK